MQERRQNRAYIIHQLQKELLLMQGFKPAPNGIGSDAAGLALIGQAFPNSSFPLAAIHEFICQGIEEASASAGFISGILSGLMKKGGVSLWISASRKIYPPALKFFGIEPHKMIFIDLKNEKQILWAMEEALKCDGLAAVISEIQEVSLITSRRFQLAVEQSGVTGFLLRQAPKNLITSSVTRWKVSALPTFITDGLPGLGFPAWKVDLLKVRNGKPGSWQIEWRAGKFEMVHQQMEMEEWQRKTG